MSPAILSFPAPSLIQPLAQAPPLVQPLHRSLGLFLNIKPNLFLLSLEPSK